MRVSDAYPAVVQVDVCSGCGHLRPCACSPTLVCSVCALPLEACYCDAIMLTEADIEICPPPTPLLPNLPSLGDVL